MVIDGSSSWMTRHDAPAYHTLVPTALTAQRPVFLTAPRRNLIYAWSYRLDYTVEDRPWLRNIYPVQVPVRPRRS